MDIIKIAFFWHMHQPCYKKPTVNQYILPWVRMHCIREYYDMVMVLENFPGIRQTFNIVPSLIDQILDYTKEDVSDLFLEYTMRPAKELSIEDKKFILKNFFMANWATMIKPFPAYWNLLIKRGMRELNDKDLTYASVNLSTQDFLDIQVWFNLTWFGFYALRKKPELLKLIKKGKNFTEEDKKRVIELQFDIIKDVLPAYKMALTAGQIEITTTPFYHPIMPLLYDTEFARRNMGDTILPDRLQAPEDILVQVKKAIELHEKVFGEKPKGLWPSEGSVAPELIPILRKCGIDWIATDEEILFHSIPGKNKGDTLYKPYSAVYGGEEIDIVFRDKGLSDFFGFRYYNNPPEVSINDFFHHITSIKKHVLSRGEDPVVFIILDGENPWENYQNGGEKFLTELYKKISKEPSVKAVGVGEYLENNPPKIKIDNLFTGSWINHNFNIWIGHQEDRDAWDLIKKTRTFLKNYIKDNENISKEIINNAWEMIYVSQGSDWFWWYGEDFSSDTDEEFDQLFRSYLAKVYMLLNVDVPVDLLKPIKKTREDNIQIKPNAFINPHIDGIETNYFEWLAAGRYSLEDYGSTMFREKGYFSSIYYGFNAHTLFIRIDPDKEYDTFISKQFDIHLRIFYSREYKIVFSCEPGNVGKVYKLYSSMDGVKYEKIKELASVGIKNIVELAIPFKELGLRENDEIKFAVELKKDNVEVERYPRYLFISCMVPEKNFEELMWSAI